MLNLYGLIYYFDIMEQVEKYKVKAGMFQLISGEIVANAENINEVRCVVAYVDENKRKFLGICPQQRSFPWASRCFDIGLQSNTVTEQSGKLACKLLLQKAAKNNINLPAIDFCVKYRGNGVEAGEAFLPTRHESRRIFAAKNNGVLQALRSLGLKIQENRMWTSSACADSVCIYNAGNGFLSWGSQNQHLIAYPVVEVDY